MTVKFSCVIDQHPRFAQQALVWASSLLVYGGQESDSLVIHSVGECNPKYRSIFEAWEIDTRIVQRFDRRHPNSNKLAQLESEPLHSADHVVLCDCDIAFCGDVSPWIEGESIRARVASSAGLPPHRWQKVFDAAGLRLPEARVEAVVTRVNTLPTYCNGGLYILPQALFQRLHEAWPRWDQWLLDRDELIRPFAEFVDQISFAMSCEELGLSVDYIPLMLNFDTLYLSHELSGGIKKAGIHPIVLHYHRLNSSGLLRLTRIPSVNRQIRKINELIRLARRVNFDKSSLLLLREKRPLSNEMTRAEGAQAR
jgi:hypothetical protein